MWPYVHVFEGVHGGMCGGLQSTWLAFDLPLKAQVLQEEEKESQAGQDAVHAMQGPQNRPGMGQPQLPDVGSRVRL